MKGKRVENTTIGHVLWAIFFKKYKRASIPYRKSDLKGMKKNISKMDIGKSNNSKRELSNLGKPIILISFPKISFMLNISAIMSNISAIGRITAEIQYNVKNRINKVSS